MIRIARLEEIGIHFKYSARNCAEKLVDRVASMERRLEKQMIDRHLVLCLIIGLMVCHCTSRWVGVERDVGRLVA